MFSNPTLCQILKTSSNNSLQFLLGYKTCMYDCNRKKSGCYFNKHHVGGSKKVRVMTKVFKKSSIVKKIPRQKWRKCATLRLWCSTTKSREKFRNHAHGTHDLTLNSQAFESDNTHHTESRKSEKLTKTSRYEGICKHKENKNKKHNITIEQVHGELIAQTLVAWRSSKGQLLPPRPWRHRTLRTQEVRTRVVC